LWSLAGAPLIVAPLAQDQAKRAPEAFEGDAIRSDLAMLRLSEYERHHVNEAKAASANALGKSAAKIRDKHDKELAERISVKSGVSLVTALRLVQARHRGVLYPDVELEFDHLGTVTVGDVLTDPDRFIGETLADPLEGVSYGRGKAMVLKGDDGNVLIHSFAHGRGVYLLRYDLKSATAAFAQGDGTVDHAMAILAYAEIEADEIDAFIRVVSERTGVGLRPLSARAKKVREEREQRERKRRDAAHTASIAAKSGGRMIRPRPNPAGELGPIVSLIDQVLADDASDEPPMRNANGALVRVEEREPWALHLLTSDGANATGAEDAETLKPPAEPMLTELTAIGVELLIERYIAWIGDIGFMALPTPFILALMEYPNTAVPVVRAINTAPLITASGCLIDGAGFDRATGLVHRVDPVLRRCLPHDRPTEEEIKGALNFLLNDWLIDVALDRVGKCVAVLLALTLLQRALLPERPAFFVTAGQRGGGKTTLISMIIAAVLGRRPAAAGWSDSVEERRKALFSYLRQNVAALVWDNIARGSSIGCPHIEAALTAPEISDRVLGVSCVETVPATTVQIFTGNSIAPRGDMASRSFIVSLNVDRPDPENRSFAHADALTWTQANRTKILRALYTILVGGVLQRPEGQVAKTRFKTWWGVIGWPVEYAAGLIDIKLDCGELSRAGEAKEEDASAASRVLTIFRKRWEDKVFTARDVVRTLEEMNSPIDKSAEQAEELFEALGELLGKTLDRPTARSIGKLFQKHLTDRPAWIDNGKRIAILRKASDHQANQYKVQIPQPTADAQPRAEADVGTSQDAGETSNSSQGEAPSQGKPLF
jgi:hypothetical protein